MEINNVEPDVLHFTSAYVSKIPKTDILWKIPPPEFKFKLKQNKTNLKQRPLPPLQPPQHATLPHAVSISIN